MAKPNYKFDKRQRDIAKQKKQDEKRMKKLANKPDTKGPEDGTTAEPAGASEVAGDTTANPPAGAAKP